MMHCSKMALLLSVVLWDSNGFSAQSEITEVAMKHKAQQFITHLVTHKVDSVITGVCMATGGWIGYTTAKCMYSVAYGPISSSEWGRHLEDDAGMVIGAYMGKIVANRLIEEKNKALSRLAPSLANFYHTLSARVDSSISTFLQESVDGIGNRIDAVTASIAVLPRGAVGGLNQAHPQVTSSVVRPIRRRVNDNAMTASSAVPPSYRTPSVQNQAMSPVVRPIRTRFNPNNSS